MHYSNKHHKPGVKYQINNLVYLLTKNLTLPKHRAQKLMPKFIGPYKIIKVVNESLDVTLELPQEFKDRKINPTFHTSLVRPYIKNNDILFPKRETKVYYDFGNDKDQEWLVKEILASRGGMPTPCTGLNAAESGNFWKQKANTYKPPLRGRVILWEIKQRHLAKDKTEGK